MNGQMVNFVSMPKWMELEVKMGVGIRIDQATLNGQRLNY